MDRGACWATVHWVAKSRPWLKWLNMQASYRLLHIPRLCVAKFEMHTPKKPRRDKRQWAQPRDVNHQRSQRSLKQSTQMCKFAIMGVNLKGHPFNKNMAPAVTLALMVRSCPIPTEWQWWQRESRMQGENTMEIAIWCTEPLHKIFISSLSLNLCRTQNKDRAMYKWGQGVINCKVRVLPFPSNDLIPWTVAWLASIPFILFFNLFSLICPFSVRSSCRG